MDRYPIRHLATAEGTDLFLAANFNGPVHVFRRGNPKRLITVEARLDFGGTRLALQPGGAILTAGSYTDHCAAGYDAATGERLWHRKGFKRLQRLRAISEDRLFCWCDGRAGTIVDAHTGEIMETIPRTEDLLAAHGIRLRARGNQTWVDHGDGTTHRVVAPSFAILGHAIGPTSMVTANPTTTSRAHDFSGNLLWTAEDTGAWRDMSLWYSGNTFYALQWLSSTSYGSYRLVRFDEQGRIEVVTRFQGGYAVAWTSNSIITANGTEHDLASGRLVGSYDFSTT